MKRKGIARLIPWLIGLDVLLFSVLLIVNIFHIRVDGAPATSIPTLPPQDAISIPTATPFEMSGDPEKLLIDNSDVDRPAETMLPVGDAEQNATLVAGSFALRGGPEFSLYLDQSLFQLIENEGRCYFCPQDNASDLYLEVAYFNGARAETLAASVFQDYGIIIQKNDVETTELNGQSAFHVSAKTMENQLEAYVMDAQTGCVTLIFCTPGSGSLKTQSALAASMQSFALVQNPS